MVLQWKALKFVLNYFIQFAISATYIILLINILILNVLLVNLGPGKIKRCRGVIH